MQHPPRTTAAHELALPVVFESGLLHFADSPAAYRRLPEPAKELLRAIPVAWDETRLLGGQPGQWLGVARRAGEDWYVGVINGGEAELSVEFPLRFLGAGEYTLKMLRDGNAGLASSQATVDAQGTLANTLRPRGGVVAQLVPATRAKK